MAKRKTDDLEKLSFEEGLDQLDGIVDALDSESIPLEDLINHYDRGMKLLGLCQNKLESARQRVEVIGQQTNSPGLPDQDPTNTSEAERNELF